MEAKLLLSLPEGFEVTSIEVTDGILTIGAVSTQKSACCPLCFSPATRVHSSYGRTLADLPCAGQQVRLLLRVRKFFCQVERCARKIFVERIAPFIEPWARVTARLHQMVQMIGFATGGMLGARVTERLGAPTRLHDDYPPHDGASNSAGRTDSGIDPELGSRRREICYTLHRRVSWAKRNEHTPENSSNRLYNSLKPVERAKQKEQEISEFLIAVYANGVKNLENMAKKLSLERDIKQLEKRKIEI